MENVHNYKISSSRNEAGCGMRKLTHSLANGARTRVSIHWPQHETHPHNRMRTPRGNNNNAMLNVCLIAGKAY